jgi:hypothetical protein
MWGRPLLATEVTSLGMFGVAGTYIEESGLLLGMAPELGQFVATLGRAFLFSLAPAFSLIALLLLAGLFFLTFVEC